MDDDLSAIVGGLVGTTAMTLVLFVADALTGFELRAFETIAAFVGVPDRIFVGFLLYFAAGTFAWAFLFVSLGQFLPGDTDALRGMVFATVLWIAFALTFGVGLGRRVLVLYLAVTLLAHLVYGFTLGTVYGSLAEHRYQHV